jgi:hypothetical protein
MVESILLRDNPLVYPGYDQKLTGEFILRETYITYTMIEDRPPVYEICDSKKYGDDIVYQIKSLENSTKNVFRLGSHFISLRKKLQTKFLGLYVPPIAKTSGTDNEDRLFQVNRFL